MANQVDWSEVVKFIGQNQEHFTSGATDLTQVLGGALNSVSPPLDQDGQKQFHEALKANFTPNTPLGQKIGQFFESLFSRVQQMPTGAPEASQASQASGVREASSLAQTQARASEASRTLSQGEGPRNWNSFARWSGLGSDGPHR